MSVDATILVKTLDGQYKFISSEDIEQVFINKTGEKMVFFKGGYGIEVDSEEVQKEQRYAKIVKGMVAYILKDRGCFVNSSPEGPMKEWFSGFWLTDEDTLLGHCIRCAERLADYAMEEFPKGIIKVGNIEMDKTFHDDRGQFYYNIGLELGGVE